jgi:probable HAF family extracellular repeat protein
VGSYRKVQLDPSQAFAWKAGKVRLLAVPEGDDSGVATAINNAGVIVGTSSTPNRGTRPLRWLPGSDDAQELPGLHGDLDTYWTTPHAVNAEGTVVGTCTLANYSFHACAWPADGGPAQDLGALPGDQPSYAFAINRAGVIAGQATAEDGSSHAVLFSGGQIIDLQSLTERVPQGVHLASAVAINNHGWILVHAETEGTDHARHFLLQPKH